MLRQKPPPLTSPTAKPPKSMIASDIEALQSEDGPGRRYKALIAEGALQADPAQAQVVDHLERLHHQLKSEDATQPQATAGGILAQFKRKFWQKPPNTRSTPPRVRGLYIHGPVGRGKSMAMDLFFEGAPALKKRRVHFHAFMQNVHGWLRDFRKEAGPEGTDQAIPALADHLFGETTLLCFDEFHVQNIADAMILGRLFGRLFDLGLIMVATSNFPPDRLYENGLNRDRFLPFIDRLKNELSVVSLEGLIDYRLERLQNLPVYYCPDGPAAKEALRRIFALLTDEDEGSTDEIAIGSRNLLVPKAARGVAWFDFSELCEQPLGAADYLALAERYHTLIVEGVPLLTRDGQNEARRFMILVDALYECRVNLVISADAEPGALYQAGDGAFEFERTASRLMEMRSQSYIETPPSTTAVADFVPSALTTDLI